MTRRPYMTKRKHKRRALLVYYKHFGKLTNAEALELEVLDELSSIELRRELAPLIAHLERIAKRIRR